MPVNIYRVTPEGQKNQRIAWLCDDEWHLRPQVDALISWLNSDAANIESAEYVADVGFCWRRDASAGGPVLEPETLSRMAAIGMSLFLSEYPGFDDDSEDDCNDPPSAA